MRGGAGGQCAAAHRRHLQSHRRGQSGRRAAADRAKHRLHVRAGKAALPGDRSAGAARPEELRRLGARRPCARRRGARTRPASTASCCATAGSTDPAPGRRSRPGRDLFMSTRPRRPRLLAVTRGAPGIYNIAEDDGAVRSSRRATNLASIRRFGLKVGPERLAQEFRAGKP